MSEGMTDNDPGDRTPISAGAAEIGTKLWYPTKTGYAVRTVARRRFDPPKDGEIDRQLTFWFVEDPYMGQPGDENETVYLATEADVAAAKTL